MTCQGMCWKHTKPKGTPRPFPLSKQQLSISVPGKIKKTMYFLEAVIHTKDQKVLKDVETLVPYKYLNLKNPVISTEAEETNDAFILHISSDCFAPFVALDFDDADVIFSDNFST